MSTTTLILREIATLRRPVTATAVLATILTIAAPFGLHLASADVGEVTGAIAGVGVVAAYADKLRERSTASPDRRP